MSIIKMRDSDHSKVAKEFEVTDQGVVVTDELIGTQGLLGWSALRVTGA